MLTKIKLSGLDELRELRKGYLGGSDAGAVMGLNTYKGPFALWAEKTGRLPEFEGNVATKVGLYLEKLVARLFEEETGKKVRRVNFSLINSDYPFAIANVDRVVSGERALLETKTTNSFENWKLIRGGEYPASWYCQVMHYLAVTGYERAYLAALIGGKQFRVFTVERDQTEIDSLMAAEASFWQHVTADTPPEPSGLDSDGDALARLYPESRPQKADLFAMTGCVQEYAALGVQLKELKERQDELKNRLCVSLGEAETGVCGGYTVSWKSQSRRTFDTKRFEQDYPDMTQGYYNTGSSRVFKIR